MRRPKDPKDPKITDAEEPKPGGHARDRLDLFNRQRGLPTDPAPSTPKDETEDAGRGPPKTKRTQD